MAVAGQTEPPRAGSELLSWLWRPRWTTWASPVVRSGYGLWDKQAVICYRTLKSTYLPVHARHLSFTLLHEAAELHLAVPLPILTGEVFIIPLQNVTLLAEVLNHCAVRESLALGGVTGVTPVLWLIWRLTHCQ